MASNEIFVIDNLFNVLLFICFCQVCAVTLLVDQVKVNASQS